MADGVAEASPAAFESLAEESLPPLSRDRSFWGMTLTQFLGAFNDNLFKQLLLLLSLPVAAGAASVGEDRQWLAMLFFAAPFLIFSGVAGYVSERYSKRSVIVWSKVAEIAVMAAGLLGFLLLGSVGIGPLLMVLFLMGAQSAFFGPGKYGILPEILRERDLPQANGAFLMTTFLAILFGTAAAGGLTDHLRQHLWFAALPCIAVAVIGTGTSLLVRPVPAVDPGLRFSASNWTVPAEVRQLFRRDRPLTLALLASCVFWLVGGIVHPSVNSLGKLQLGLSDTRTSLLAVSVGVGIALGALAAGRLSGGRVNFRLIRWGGRGILISLIVLSLNLPGGRHLLGPVGSLVGLLVLGVFTAMFAVPLQVFLQTRPPRGQKGRTIAVMNQANWIAIILSALLYKLFLGLLVAFHLPPCTMFAFTALLMLPVVLFYHPHEEPLPRDGIAGGE